jgi:serpin B
MDFRFAYGRNVLRIGAIALLAATAQPSRAEIIQTPAKTSDEASKSRASAVLTAQAKLGSTLIQRLTPDKPGDHNILVSPASLASILSFVELGGSDELRLAIHRALGYAPGAKSSAGQDMKDLRSGVAVRVGGSKDSPTSLANLLVFDPSTRPRQMSLLAVSGAGADVLVDDLSETKTIERINQWVRERTHDLIPSIIEESPATLGLVAINALYFKDRWKLPFDAARTEQAQFTLQSGKTADVMMMHSPNAKFAFRESDRFVAAELAYANDDFRLVVVTTKSAPAGANEFAEVLPWLNGGGFAEKSGEIFLPKLAISTSEEMLGPLDALGLKQARRAPDALKGFSPASLAISRVVQKLELHVDEVGTEGAASTAVIATRSAALGQPVRMVVDKPFMFALRDLRTGLILFMGYVGSPQKLAAK